MAEKLCSCLVCVLLWFAALVYDKKTVVLSILGTYFKLELFWIILFLTIISNAGLCIIT